MNNIDNEWLNLYERVSQIPNLNIQIGEIVGSLEPKTRDLKERGVALAATIDRKAFLNPNILAPFQELSREWNELLEDAILDTYSMLIEQFGLDRAYGILSKSCPNFTQKYIRN